MLSFSQIQFVQSLREEIEQIDIYQLRHHPTSYNEEFGRNLSEHELIFTSVLFFFQLIKCINIQVNCSVIVILEVQRLEIVIHFRIIVKEIRHHHHL